MYMLSSDWFIGLFAPVVIGLGKCFGFGLLHSNEKGSSLCTAYLKGPLQDTNRELRGGVCGEPEPKIRVRLADSLQDLLKFPQPLHQQVTVLKHKPLTSCYRSFKELQRKLLKE